ncbi:condensation domain-containing protein [Streptosporangium roseum]|uniref:Non-ribosomal peptide synthase/polyketide synthase n=1 Tax=Streptosporangium roseum (strain ATCC 12428 / DSM 43021 / JCM 3005 / KCTC 9067 / NCIMB 10171 / NRRL 2505 / NI 9100) TaxID=479432 RepID=D2B5N7_STRRD|nr:condensation domain-containing protein [Streptosporangium roseum]ACZ89542.1 non-ribosomal peptide synthase/polyketide synthase [Streptosporangium roseum DSM 43021]
MTTPDQRAALLSRLAELPPERREALLGRARDRDAGRTWPLSFGQERLWFLSRFDPADTTYHTPWCVRLRGPVDADGIAAALTRVAGRHHVLRTRFRLAGDRPVQVVAPAGPVAVERRDVTGDPAPAVVEFVNRPFDLEAGPPLRVALMRLAGEDFILCVVLHHIVVDGWSLDVLMRELAECYAAHREGREPLLAELPTQYTDVAAEDRRRAEHEDTAHLDHWTRTLAGAPVLDLPADHPRPARWTGRGGQESLLVPDEVITRLEGVARQQRCTLFMALLAAYQVTLGLAAGQEDLCVGVPVAGRNRVELEPLIGYFATTLALRADLSGDPTFRELLKRTRLSVFRGLQHAEVPFERILGALRLPRDLSRPPLLQAMFNLHNLPKGDLLRTEMADLAVEVYPMPPAGRTKAEISVDAWRGPEGLGGVLDYNSDLFSAGTARRLVRAFTDVVERAGTDPDLRLSDLRGV